MGSTTSLSVLIPLLSALFGGVVVALVNHFLSKDVRKASLDKMRAETDKTIAEAEITKRKLQEVATDVQNVRSEVSDTQGKINTLVKYSLAFYLFDHLSHLYHDQEYRYSKRPEFERDLRFLRDHGYVEHFGIRQLQAGENLIGKVHLTPLGKLLVELREHDAQHQSASTP